MAKRNRVPRDTPAARYQALMRELVTPPLRFNVMADHKVARYWKTPDNNKLNLIEDRRQWHPERWGRPVLGMNRAATRLVVGKSPKLLPPTLAFADPRRVIVCLRRKIRREVINALGKGGGGNARPTRKPTSEIQC